MFSIRTKFILALLVISLTSTAVVGGLAYQRLMRKFEDAVLENAARNFRQDVAAYIKAYGSWEQAQEHEPFPAFSARRRLAMGLPLASGPAAPDAEFFRPRVDDVQLAPLAASAPAAPPDDLRRPPFLFYLFDTEHRALMPLPPYRIGDAMQPGLHDTVQPIELDGHVVAYFSPEGHINYSALDLGYLAAIREALLYGLIAAIVLALVLGIAFGSRLSAALVRLTSATRAVADGQLRQEVTIESDDEVGALAYAFNRMSNRLVASQEQLEQAHEQLRQQAVRLEELSVRDSLTGLHNRRFFDDQARRLFEHAQRYQRPFTVVIGDVDGFKRINDQLSHATGDTVLRVLGEILRARLRSTDVVARYGGEEFAVAFPETTPTAAAEVCEVLRRTIEEHPWQALHPELKVTMSIGVYGETRVGSLDAMLAQADRLLYVAKSSGRNRVCIENIESAPSPG